MQSSLSECPVCSFEYTNDSKTLPKTLMCGHTICLKCLSDIIRNGYNPKCPLDRKPLQYTRSDDFPTNTLVLQLLEERRRNKTELCPIHQEPIVFLRMEDKVKICGFCYYIERGIYDIRHIEEIKKQANDKMDQLRWIENELRGYQTQIQAQLDQKKDAILHDIQKTYDKLHEALYQKEERLKLEVNLFFAHQMHTAEQRLDQDYIKVSEIQKLIKSLASYDLTNEFFDNLEKKFEKTSSEEIKTTIEDIQSKLQGDISQKFEEGPEDSIIRIVSDFIDVKKADDEVKLSSRLILPPQDSFTKEDFEEIKKSLSEAKSIRLTNSHLDSSKQFFESFCAIWQYMQSINSLSIELPCNNELTSQTVSIFRSSNLCGLERITDFALDLQACEDVSANALIALFQGLVAKMDNIKSLNLALSNVRMVDEKVSIGLALDQIFRLLYDKLASVRTLSLHLEEDIIKDEDIKDFSFTMMQSMPFLESFTFHIDGTEITDFGIIQLFKSLADASRDMKYLELGLSQTSLTKKSIGLFIKKVLPNMNNLQMLVLYLQETKIDEDEMVKLLVELKKYMREDFDFRIQLADSEVTKRIFERCELNENGEGEEKEEGEGVEKADQPPVNEKLAQLEEKVANESLKKEGRGKGYWEWNFSSEGSASDWNEYPDDFETEE